MTLMTSDEGTVSTKSPIPFVVFGDAPTTSTGLGRIARDLCAQIYRAYVDSPLHGKAPDPQISLVQVGWQPTSGAQAWPGPWSLVTFNDTSDWGAAALIRTLRSFDTPGVVFACWDAARLFESAPYIRSLGWELWIYPALDAANANEMIGGPAGEVIRLANRVVAYGAWAQRIYQKTLDAGEFANSTEIATIPHGVANFWQPATRQPADYDRWRIGCVATNQTRKDLPLFFATIVKLRNCGHPAKGWLHTSSPVGAYSIPELTRINNLTGDDVLVTYTDDQDVPYPDTWLRAMYQRCGVTLGVGRGEGFGYPLVESIACGVPAVHHGWGGGAELVPVAWHMITDPKACTTEGVFALQRPVLTADAAALAIEGIICGDRGDTPEVITQFAARYRWPEVWPRWEDWINQGLADFAARGAETL